MKNEEFKIKFLDPIDIQADNIEIGWSYTLVKIDRSTGEAIIRIPLYEDVYRFAKPFLHKNE